MASPFGDNVLFKQLWERQVLGALVNEYKQFPRRTIQISGGAMHNEALAFARYMKQQIPSLRVIYRYSDDDNIHRYWNSATGRHEERMTPEASANFLADISQGGIVPSYNNEPHAGTLREIVDHALKTITHLKARGVKDCVMMNWHTGFIPNLENQWRHELDELCQAIIAAGYTMGGHEYFNTQFLENPQKPFYMGRYRYIKIKYPALKYLMTEVGADGALQPNPQLHGYKNHKQIWQQLFPKKSYTDVYWDEMVKADETFYAHDNIDILWYCRGNNGSSRWEPFNYIDEPQLINRMKVYRRKVMSQTPDLKPLHNAVVTAAPTAGLNVRVGTSTNVSILGTLKVGDAILISQKSFSAGGYNWYQVERGTLKGYIAHTNTFNWNPKSPTAQSGGGLTQEQWNKLNSAVNSLETASAALKAFTQEVKPSSSGGGF